MSDPIPANESTLGRFVRSIREGWQSLPRIVQWGIVSGGLATVQAKFPGHIPADLTPEVILGAGALGAAMHHVEDRHEDAQQAK